MFQTYRMMITNNSEAQPSSQPFNINPLLCFDVSNTNCLINDKNLEKCCSEELPKLYCAKFIVNIYSCIIYESLLLCVFFFTILHKIHVKIYGHFNGVLLIGRKSRLQSNKRQLCAYFFYSPWNYRLRHFNSPFSMWSQAIFKTKTLYKNLNFLKLSELGF